MNMQMKHLNPNDRAPKIPRQQRNVEERRTRKPKHDRRPTVKDKQTERIPRQIPPNLPIPPNRALILRAIENPRLRPRYQHPPKPQLSHNLIKRPLRHQKLLGDVSQAVECCAC